MKASELLVEVDQVRGQARELAVPLEGGLDHIHRPIQGVGEGEDRLGLFPRLREGEEGVLGARDVIERRLVGIERPGADLVADPHQVPARGEVQDRASAVYRHAGGRGLVNQSEEIRRAAEVGEGGVRGEGIGEQGGGDRPARRDGFGDGIEEALVKRLEEVRSPQPVGEAFHQAGVVKDRAEEIAFGGDVGG